MLDRIWFGISDMYAIKRYMHLSGMQLTDFVCTDIQLIHTDLAYYQF